MITYRAFFYLAVSADEGSLSDDRNLALVPLMFDLLRSPDKLPQFVLVSSQAICGCLWFGGYSLTDCL